MSATKAQRETLDIVRRVRLKPSTVEAIERLAAQQDRTFSYLVRRYAEAGSAQEIARQEAAQSR